MTFSDAIGTVGLALIQGALVGLPRAGALGWLRRLGSPAWGAVLPATILVGTFGVLALPSMAHDLVVLAAVTTPVLALVSAVAVVRLRRLWIGLAPLALAALLAPATTWVGETSEAVVTALGCLALGTALVRLMSARVLVASVLAMCVVDVVLMIVGPGLASCAVMADATAQFHGPAFDQAVIGSISIDYPDLILAAVIGVMIAPCRPLQRRAALLVTALCTGYGIAAVFTQRLPATVPIVVALVVARLISREKPPDARAPEPRSRPARRLTPRGATAL